MVKSGLGRLAFTLIELLFAIIIMGITMVSVPVIMSSNARGFDTTIIQEAIFAASAELNQVLSYRWDENSIDETTDPNAIGLSAVIESIPGSCENNSSSIRYRLSNGHIAQPLHRKCIDSNITTPSTTFGLDVNETALTADDIDDINKNLKDMFINDSPTTTGYKHAYQSKFKISYATIDTVNAADKNAKLIEIIVKDDEDNNVTVLRSYTLNIGEIDFYKRTY